MFVLILAGYNIGFLFYENNYVYSYDHKTQEYEKSLNLSSHGVALSNIIHLSMINDVIEIVENHSNSQSTEYILLEPEYTESTYALKERIYGNQTITIVFLPGCNIDLEWIQFG